MAVCFDPVWETGGISLRDGEQRWTPRSGFVVSSQFGESGCVWAELVGR